MNRVKKPFWKRRSVLSPIIAVLLLVVLYTFPSWTPVVKDLNGNAVENGIAELKRIELGGVPQYIQIRGASRDNPVLLFLHGGPGYPQIAFARKYQRQLEQQFIVVNWDQRGSGKSYHWNMDEDDLKVDRLVEDTAELTRYLRERFGQDDIYIAGHSWGSTLGVLTVRQYPELYRAYIGIGQVADSMEGERLSYEFALSEAQRRGNEKAVRELEAIGAPPYANPRKDTSLERKWVAAFGGSERNIDSNADLLRGILWAPEYTWLDGLRLGLGNTLSLRAIRPQTENLNLNEAAPRLDVPIYIMMGRHDYMTPSAAAYDYYETLEAPHKQFVWFEESAHFPHFEEEDKFYRLMVEIKNRHRPQTSA